MRDLEKYRGIIPAFYACYEDDGSVSAERTQALTQHLIDKNVKSIRAKRNASSFWKM